MLTAEDDHIRHLDIPERMQLASASLKQPEIDETGTIPAYIAKEDLPEAARWMSKRISSDITERFCMEDASGELPALYDEFIQAVQYVLEFINVDFLEVPFIWQHRADYIVKYGEHDPVTGKTTENIAFLQQDDIFKIEQLSIKYRALLARKQELKALYDSVGLQDDYFDDYFDNLNTVEDAADLNDWLTMRYGEKLAQHKQDTQADEDGLEGSLGQTRPQRKKRATRESAYEMAKKSVVSRLAEVSALGPRLWIDAEPSANRETSPPQSIGLNAWDLSRAMSTGTRIEFEDPSALPLEYAEEYSGAIEYPSPNTALSGKSFTSIVRVGLPDFPLLLTVQLPK